MGVIPVHILDLDYIRRLIENAVCEDSHIEYKAELKFRSDDDKKELLADVSAFANAGGGNIIYGVEEGDKGEPISICGLSNFNSDQDIRSVRSILEDGLSPRIPGLEIRLLNGEGATPLLLIHIPQSWLAPHMLTFKGRSRFVARKGNMKSDLNVQEIRSAFNLSEELPRRIERFRDERVALIIGAQGAIPLGHTGKIIVHFIPMSAMTARTSFELKDLLALAPDGGMFDCSGYSSRFNVNGWLKYHVGEVDTGGAYVQYYRNGIVEAVDTTLIMPIYRRLAKQSSQGADGGRTTYPTAALRLEKAIITEVETEVKFFKNAGMEYPVFVFVTITGLHGASLVEEGVTSMDVAIRDMKKFSIDEEVLRLPSVEMDAEPVDVAQFLKPAFDVLWQASGRAFSPHYDQNGKYKH